jgi:hypothetical protein
MQDILQESLEMHAIDTQTSSHHRSGSTGSFAHQSRMSEGTRPTTTDAMSDNGSQLLYRDRRSEVQEPGPSAALPATHMPEDELQQAQDTFGPPLSNTPGLLCGIRSAQPKVTTSAEQDGLHLQPSRYGNKSVIKPLLSGPGDPDHQSKECRKKSNLTTVRQAVLDVCITATSLYFLGFAIASSVHKGEPAASGFADSLLQAARFVGNFLATLRRTSDNKSDSGSHYLAYHVRCHYWAILDSLHSLAAGT